MNIYEISCQLEGWLGRKRLCFAYGTKADVDEFAMTIDEYRQGREDGNAWIELVRPVTVNESVITRRKAAIAKREELRESISAASMQLEAVCAVLDLK